MACYHLFPFHVPAAKYLVAMLIPLQNGYSALTLASIEGHGAVTKVLLKYKASVTAQNPVSLSMSDIYI